jgi:hypothetical protein
MRWPRPNLGCHERRSRRRNRMIWRRRRRERKKSKFPKSTKIKYF